MKVKLARTCGFCMGVRRAMELVLTESNRKKGPLYTYGPLIHNKQVLALLESKGVKVVDHLEGPKEGRIVIRAHGIPPKDRQTLRESGMKVLDATCPKVARVQAIIRYHTKKGYTGLIVGDEDHPEVVGLKGYAEGPVHVVRCVEDLSRLRIEGPLFMVAQTTQDQDRYGQVADALKDRTPAPLVFDTICGATRLRQEEVKSFAGAADGLVVVGGRHSGNTQRLVQIARESGLLTFHVETEKELDRAALGRMGVVGVTAGASTPNWMIQNVVREIEAIRGASDRSLTRWAASALKFMVMSHFFGALAAFCLSSAALTLMGRGGASPLVYPLITALYVYAMHAFNRVLDKGASTYNDPERARFHGRYGTFLVGLGGAAIFASLLLAYAKSFPTFFLLAALSLLGVLYSIPLVPRKVHARSPYARIKDIPGSKTLSEVMAWVALIAAPPLLESHGDLSLSASTLTIVVVFLMCHARILFFDVLRIQGDLIVGTETLPVTLGERRSLGLIRGGLLACGIILATTPLLGWLGGFAFLLLLPTSTLYLCEVGYRRRRVQAGLSLEALVDANFILAGLMALLWRFGPWSGSP
jgi:(E)-4-hydroxy-3-methyl-but-2-enyl pyrophosphate reductase